ncbi:MULTISPECIES: aldolase catalytic domain-containing protein [unclassified Clostridium]|uniref:aldolase catalytic domain-containing protein n=1 Tax=unclassified Clostridium TaxID=2614128 RepID=UPI002079F4DD|nr:MULTISPECIES: aldolase catalytic domain-containing protein [unclassified Clostridium]
MGNIKILDCTLRDGGYVNDWNFGERIIKKIIDKLSKSNIDIIECGFLTTRNLDKNKSLFNDLSKIKNYIEKKQKNIMYVGMIAYPNDIINNIPFCDNNSIDGIRVTFHQHEIDDALRICQRLKTKGYKVFVQPVGIVTYDDISIINLLNKVNELEPYAFYIVDTLGSMYGKDLLRLYYLIDNNINEKIKLGFHSHNNLQLSFSNAQELINLKTKRDIIIDSSVFGMGRGAGNLCTELIANYINNNIENKYDVNYILEIMDQYLNSIYRKYPWGYSAPYCLAAINTCHPNYATYLINKQTITIKSISDILINMDECKRGVYDENYIEELYIENQKSYINDNESLNKLKEKINNRNILILGPGKSVNKNITRINYFLKENNLFSFSVNFISNKIKTDALFISNLKRLEGISDILINAQFDSIVITSNLNVEENLKYMKVNYSDLLLDNPTIVDNSGLMLINLLKKLNVKNVFVAGFDGFNEGENNYIDNDLELFKTKENMLNLNNAIRGGFKDLNKEIDITFITESIYECK